MTWEEKVVISDFPDIMLIRNIESNIESNLDSIKSECTATAAVRPDSSFLPRYGTDDTHIALSFFSGIYLGSSANFSIVVPPPFGEVRPDTTIRPRL